VVALAFLTAGRREEEEEGEGRGITRFSSEGEGRRQEEEEEGCHGFMGCARNVGARREVK